MTGLRHLTGGDCADILARLREVLGSMDIELESLPLWNDLADVRWLTAFNCAVLREHGGAADVDRRRTVAGFIAATSISRSVKAIGRSASLGGFEHKIRHLKNWRLRPPTDENTEQAAQAGDHLYEIEVAARLSFTFSELRFDEPDLLAHDPESNFKFAIACKRPRTTRGFMRAAKQAVAQVRQSDAFGAVILSADNLIDQMVRDLSGERLRGECRSRVSRIIDTTSGDVLRSLSGHPPRREGSPPHVRVSGVLGALVTGSFLLLGRDGPGGPSFLNTAFVPAMINKNEPHWARPVLAAFLDVLQQGENALVATP